MARILIEHFKHSRAKLMAYSQHLDLPNHPDIKGNAREGLISIFLKNNLPTIVEYCTGEIIDHNDNRSGQIDIIIQSSFSPRINLFEALNISLVDSVLAAIEVKSTLTTSSSWENNSHLKTALKSVEKIKSLERNQPIFGTMTNGDKITLRSTPCFIFAYSGPTHGTLIERLNNYGNYFNLRQDEYWPEVITVLDKGYYVIKNDGWLIEKFDSRYNHSHNLDTENCLSGMFSYICKIIEAWHFSPYPTQFQKYFQNK